MLSKFSRAQIIFSTVIKVLMSLRKFFLVILFSLPLMVFAQVKDQQLADQYFYSQEYDKAVTLYEKLYDKNPFVYNNYLRCLLELNQTDKAEKLVKKQSKKDPGNPVLMIDMGQAYFRKNNSAEARKQYESALKMLPADQTVIINTANAFMAIRENDFALQTYLEGRKLLHGAYTFRFELAQVYFMLQNFQGMLDEYMGALEENPGYLQSVQNMLQSRFSTDDETDNGFGELLRTTLLRKIQKSNESVFAELLIWYFVQQKDFESAFVQAKAVDKRLNETGSRLISLGQLSAANQDYDAAIKCFQYIIDKGKSNFYYTTARMEMLNARNKKVIETGKYTMADLLRAFSISM